MKALSHALSTLLIVLLILTAPAVQALAPKTTMRGLEVQTSDLNAIDKKIQDWWEKNGALDSLLWAEGKEKDPDGFGFIKENGARFGLADPNIRLAKEKIKAWIHTGQEVVVLENGIGGQTVCCNHFIGMQNPTQGRKIKVLDSLGTDYGALENQLLGVLERGGRVILDVSSKSGATDETMINFQNSIRTLIGAHTKHIYGADSKISTALILKLFPERGRSLDDLNISIFTRTELAILRQVFLRMIVSTGSSESGSKIAKFIEGDFFKKLMKGMITEDLPLILQIEKELGGRWQMFGPHTIPLILAMDGDIDAWHKGAKGMRDLTDTPSMNNLAFKLALQAHVFGANQMILALPSEAMANLGEGIGQLIPESLGKGRSLEFPRGILTFPFRGEEQVHSALKNISKFGVPTKKIVFMVDVEGAEAMRINNRPEDMVIRYKMKDYSWYEQATLLQFMEGFTAHYGFISMTEAFQKEGVDITSLPDIVNHAIYKEYSPFLQPAVEIAKQIAKEGSFPLFLTEENKEIVLQMIAEKKDPKEILPHLERDPTLRKKAYQALQEKIIEGVYLETEKSEDAIKGFTKETRDLVRIISEDLRDPPVSEISLSDLKETLQSIEELRAEDDTAYHRIMKELEDSFDKKLSTFKTDYSDRTFTNENSKSVSEILATALYEAHRTGKTLNFMNYAEDSLNARLLNHIAKGIGFDRFDLLTQEQHKSKQLDVDGPDICLNVILDNVKTLAEVEAQENISVADGMVPEHHHGLYPSESRRVFAESYSKVFENVERHSLFLRIQSIHTDAGLKNMVLLLLRTKKIYEEMILKTTKSQDSGSPLPSHDSEHSS
jgi:hypothetical protein